MITTEYEQLETLSKQVAELQLKASIAMEMLSRRIETMQIQIQEGRGYYSEADLADFEESCLFLNKYYGKKYSV